MLWPLWVVDPLLDLHLDHLPLPLELWKCSCHGNVSCHPAGFFALTNNMCWNNFYFHTCDISCSMPGILWVDEMCCICCMSYPDHPWLCSHYRYWIGRSWSHQLLLLWQLYHWTYKCWLKSLIIISCSLAYWRRALYVTSSYFFFDLTHFLASKCFVAWKSSSVQCTFFPFFVSYWHLCIRSLMHWSSWSVVSCSPCLMSLYISLMWFQ